MSFICKAPRDCSCTLWDFGKVSGACPESCMDRYEQYDLQPCSCGDIPRLVKEGVARQSVLYVDEEARNKLWYRNHGYFVECPCCGLRTEPSLTAKDAVNEWNCKTNLVPASKVITLCGSTKFKDQFLEVQKQLALEGHIVLSVGLFGHSGDNEAWDNKKMLDALHKRKIAMSDEIFVINVGGYIGESTAMEIAFAEKMCKTVRYLEEKKDG